VSEAHPSRPRVAVTGATGFVGTHLVEELLAQGYRVRALTRAPEDEARVGHLRVLPGSERLELAAVDLLGQAGLDDALADCEGLFHLAASTRLSARDPRREIVDVAVEGTKRVLDAAGRTRGLRRIILTSSVAAIQDATKPAGYVFTEADWNESATGAEPYPMAKTQAERAARAWVEAGSRERGQTLVALCPAMVLGPVRTRGHARTSPATLRDLLTRKLPACPRLHLGLVDVRDVARAHRLAFEFPDPPQRVLLYAGSLWMQEMATWLARAYPQRRVPTRRLPDLALYAGSFFDKRLSRTFLRHNLGRAWAFDACLPRQTLGLRYRPLEESLRDTAESLIAMGLA